MAKSPMEVALSALSRRRLSEGQVMAVLKKKGFDDVGINACLAKLKDWGYLDDRTLGKDVLGYLFQKCPIGRRRALYELSKRRIDKDLAEEIVRDVYEGLAEDDLALNAAEKYLDGKSRVDTKEYQRLSRWLSRQGFGSEAVYGVLRKLGAEDHSLG